MDSIIRQNQKAYDYLAKSYANEWAGKPDTQLAELFVSYLPPLARVLDVGCGPGQYSYYFHRCGFNVSGIDFSKEMISIARGTFKGIDFSQQDMRSLSFDNNIFDALWVCSSFVHIPKEEALSVLKEFRRVIKKSGYLFINAIIGDLPYRLESEEEIGGNYKGNGRYFQWYPHSLAFVDLLHNAGYSVERIVSKDVTSSVLKNATIRTNKWFNYFCRVI